MVFLTLFSVCIGFFSKRTRGAVKFLDEDAS